MTIFAGFLLAVAGLTLMGRSSLLSHKSNAWPNAAPIVNWILRITGWVFCVYSPMLIFNRDNIPISMVGIFFCMALVNTTMFINVLRQRKIYVHFTNNPKPA